MSEDKFVAANCSHCGLRNEQTGVVTGKQSALMLISDSPTMTEAVYKTQFAGMSGDLLKNVLLQVNIDPDLIHSTYATMCRVPGDRTVSAAELDCCRPRLVAEIKQCNPKIIVPMGNTALQQLLRKKEPITGVHGQILWSHEFNCHVIPCFHPDAIVKSPKTFTDFAKDWQIVVETLKNPPAPERKIDLVTHHGVVLIDRLSDCVDFLLKQEYIACDLETTGFSPITSRAFCASFSWEEGRAIVFDDDIMSSADPKITAQLKRLWETVGPRWIWQNGKFDIKFLRAKGINARIDEDTMLMHYLLDERKGTHALELLASQELGAPDYKGVIRKLVEAGGGDYSHADRPKMLEYCANDTDYTYRLYRIFDRRIRAEDNLLFAYQTVLIPASNALADFELTGVNMDSVYLDTLNEQYAKKIEEVKELLLSIADALGWDCESYRMHTEAKKAPKVFNPGSWQQLGYVIHQLLKLPKFKGSNTTDADAVDYWLTKVLKRPNDKAIIQEPALLVDWLAKSNANVFVSKLAEYRKICKLYSTYIDGLQNAIEIDGRVHSTFLIHGTECVSGDTLVWTDTGLLRIDKMCCVDWEDEGFTECSIRVLSEQGAVATSHTYIGTVRETLQVNLGYGLQIKCTPEHPLMTLNGWVKAANLTDQDYVVTSFGKCFFPVHETFPTRLAASKLFGIYLADGFCSYDVVNGNYCINISNQDQKVFNLVNTLSKILFEEEAKYDISNGTIKIRGKQITENWMKAFPTNGAANKKVPHDVYLGNKQELVVFVEGCSLDSTWSLSSTGVNKSKKALIRFNSVDRERLVLIQQILWNLGVRTSLIETEYSTKNDVRRTGEYQSLHQYQLNITGQQTQEYLKHCSPQTIRQEEYAALFTQIIYNGEGFKNWCYNTKGDVCVSVLSVTVGIKERVYDLTVPEQYNFTANGIINHNTGRLSSKGPNVQNIPRGKLIKSAFIPTKGNIFIQADYSQCIAEDTWVGDIRIQNHLEAVLKGIRETLVTTTERGYHVESTADHQILTSTGWKAAEHLQKGDWVALQGKQVKQTVFNLYSWMIGFWVGDGSYHNSPSTLQFAKGIDGEELKVLLAEALNEVPRDYGSIHSWSVTNQRTLGNWLRARFDKNDLRIPFDNMQEVELSSFLSGLFDADSSVDNNGIEFSSRFENLVNDVQQCLLRYGIMSTKIITRTGFNYIEGGKMQYKLHICDSVSLYNYAQLIGFQLVRKREKLVTVSTNVRSRDQSNLLPIAHTEIQKLGVDYRKFVLNHLNGRPYTRSKLANANIIIPGYTEYHWDQIKEITPSGREVKVYDLMDQPDNRFSANGVIVHNCELRVLAVLAKCPDMMKLYYDGKDLHDEVALELYGPGYSKDQRVRAKAFNFGLAYGRTPESIAEEHAFPIAEARALKTAWYARFPTAAAYIEWSRNTPSQGITQSTPFGRKRRFPFITRENIWNIENEAVNFPIQSTASDLTLLSAVELHNQVNSYAKILVLVHDSILFDVAQKDVSRLIPTALHVMQTLPGRYLKTDMPFVADMETGINWGNLDEYAEGVE